MTMSLPPRRKPHHRSYRGKIATMYDKQKRNSIHRNHPLPDYSNSEFYAWCVANGYTRLYYAWVDSNFDKYLTPSADRIDNALSYTFDNLQLVTWAVNLRNAHVDATKAVSQYDLKGVFMGTYDSIVAASEATGICTSRIYHCCNKQQAYTGDYIWRWGGDDKPNMSVIKYPPTNDASPSTIKTAPSYVLTNL